ncbi:MAG TPA: DUF6600 domain-containing protein [Bryobacteraceae bacterium]|nr:DUF6600 domain-containing protein [Bryobacteraceae bacterium]
MERISWFRFLTLTGAALLWAQSVAPARAQADADDAKRGVARISVMDGDVTVHRGDSGDWVAGVLNAPLMTGDQIATAANSRAEIEMDAANALRLDGDASIRIAQLEYERFQFELARGTATYRVLRPTNVNIEVDTPNLAIRPSKEGIYRVTVDDDGVSEVTVRAGTVEVAAKSGSQWLSAGQTLLARGGADDPEFKIEASIPLDAFDQWNDSRDRLELASASAQYVPPGVYGSEDLDQYGTWQDTQEYGYVWQPAEPVGWSPYSSGEWVWEDWYGWTWVPYEPWGWAPYHYGRWFFRTGIGWAWYPGARFTPHYWSPALVAFVGWGGGGFGLGYVGWVPLAPYEVMRPWWGPRFYGHPGYVNRYIGVSAVNVSALYRNAGVANGVHGVRGADFASGRFNSIGHFNGSELTDVRVASGAVPIAPTSANLRFSNRAIQAPPRAAIGNKTFFSREQPTPARQIPFSQQESGFQAARANPAAGGAARGNAPAARPSISPARPAAPQVSNGWRQVGDRPAEAATPRTQTPGRAAGPPQRTNEQLPRTNEPPQASGWQRFGASGSQAEPGAGRPPNENRPAQQPAGNSWDRFGNPGYAAPEQRPQAPQQTYRPPEPSQQPAYRPPENTYRPVQPAPQPAYRPPENTYRPVQPAPQPAYHPPEPAPTYHAPSYSAPSAPHPSGGEPRGGGGGNRGGGERR